MRFCEFLYNCCSSGLRDRSLDKLLDDIVLLLLLRVALGGKEVGEEEDPEDRKHDEELDQDQPDERLAPGHAPEAVPDDHPPAVEDISPHEGRFARRLRLYGIGLLVGHIGRPFYRYTPLRL